MSYGVEHCLTETAFLPFSRHSQKHVSMEAFFVLKHLYFSALMAPFQMCKLLMPEALVHSIPPGFCWDQKAGWIVLFIVWRMWNLFLKKFDLVWPQKILPQDKLKELCSKSHKQSHALNALRKTGHASPDWAVLWIRLMSVGENLIPCWFCNFAHLQKYE